MNLEDKIKSWVSLDNEYKRLNDKIKEVRDKKNLLSDNIFIDLEERKIQNPTINISDGKLNVSDIKLQSAITYKYLETCFKDFLKDDEKANKLLEYVKNNREINKVKQIKRIYNKD